MIDATKDHYTVVVVGSGYGAGIAASRMARTGQAVCVLERGKELIPGEYPNTEIEAAQQLQSDAPDNTSETTPTCTTCALTTISMRSWAADSVVLHW
ncbi:MAG TPA: hypothetical protein VLC51_04490 [Nitrospira sp.]|nr:hypothetical protein [Nitrospira sp.]